MLPEVLGLDDVLGVPLPLADTLALRVSLGVWLAVAVRDAESLFDPSCERVRLIVPVALGV